MMNLIKKWKRRFKRKRDQGQGMLEFALVLPILLLLIFGLIEFGRLMFIFSSVSTASRESSRYGAAVGDGVGGVAKYLDCTGIKNAAVNSGRWAGVDASTVSISYDHGPGTEGSPIGSCGSVDAGELSLGDRIVITVSVPYTPLVPLVNIPAFPISSVTRRSIIKEVHISEASPGSTPVPTTAIPPATTVAPTPIPTTAIPATTSAATLIPSFTFTVTMTPRPPDPPVYNSVTWNAQGTKCVNIFLLWTPNSAWSAYPGGSPSSYQGNIDGGPGVSITPNDPGITTWWTYVSLNNTGTVSFTVMAIFPGPLASLTLDKTFMCDKGDLVDLTP